MRRKAMTGVAPAICAVAAFMMLGGCANDDGYRYRVGGAVALDDPDIYYDSLFPYGDFKDVHRCGVLTAENRAGQYKHFDIENAAAHLRGMIDAKHGGHGPS